MMRIHENMAENRLRFAQRLNEMSDELATIVKEVDKNRKQARRFLPFSFQFYLCRVLRLRI